MLETLLLNLLSNSLQHLGSGGRVEVSVSRLGSRVILSVDDNGEGMSSEQLARLFTGRRLWRGPGAEARAGHCGAARRGLHNRGT